LRREFSWKPLNWRADWVSKSRENNREFCGQLGSTAVGLPPYVISMLSSPGGAYVVDFPCGLAAN
jgi:hypothetical protein